VIAEAVGAYAGRQHCHCASALSTAIITRRDAIPDVVKRTLAPLIGKYVS
jgi:hypothetical protein